MQGVFDALDKSESSALGIRDKRSATEALALKKGMSQTMTSMRWCHSGAQLADCMTKDSEQARSSYNLWQQRRSWRLIYDQNYISEKNRKKRGLNTLDNVNEYGTENQTICFVDDDDDAWQLVPKDWLDEIDEIEIPRDAKDSRWLDAVHGRAVSAAERTVRGM